MKLFFTKIFYCLLFICFGFRVAAQTKFTASAMPTNAGKDEYITLSLTVANGTNVQKITPPPLTDFKVVSGPSTTTEQNTINGETSQYISLSYVLLAKKTGAIKIPPATALIDGHTFKSNAINIEISKNKSTGSSQNSSGPTSMQSMLSGVDPFYEPQAQTTFSDYILRKGENIQKKVNDNMQLRLQISKSSCYVGEALLATYKLYTRLKSESNLAKNPSFSGFSVIEILQQNDASSFTIEKLDGKSYNVYIIRKAQLFPLQPGSIEVESATLDNKISFVKYDGINGNNYNIDPNSLITETVALSTKPTIINVKPLPEAGKPEGFKGAVGNFTIDAVMQKDSFTTDETAKLFVTITGEGNMHLLTLPEIKWPSNFEVFDTKISDNTDNKTVPISGSKTFEIIFSVDKEGSYIIPSINFSYFDPIAKNYKTNSTKSISFNIIKGKKYAAGFNSKDKETNGKLSLFEKLISYKSIMLLFATGLIIAGLIFWITKEKKVVSGKKIAKNIIREQEKKINYYDQRNPLTKTEDCLFKNECNSFYNILNDEIKTFLSRKFNISLEDLNNKRLAIVMDKAGISNEIILQTQELVKEIEWQLYTPYERNDGLKKMYTKAQNIVQILVDKRPTNQ
jgi:hypothetical protein